MAGIQILSLLGAVSALLVLDVFKRARINAASYAFISLNGSITPVTGVAFSGFVPTNLFITKDTKSGIITPSIRRLRVFATRTA